MLEIIGWIILAWLAFVGLICHVVLILTFLNDWGGKTLTYKENKKKIYDALREKKDGFKKQNN